MNRFMKIAIKEAQKGIELGHGGPFGAVIVKDGKIVRNEHAKIYRNGELISTTEIKSLKIVKDDVKEAGKDRECGIKTTFDEVAVGDLLKIGEKGILTPGGDMEADKMVWQIVKKYTLPDLQPAVKVMRVK